MADVLIIGGGGFFGRRIAENLVKDGLSVVLMGRTESVLKEAITSPLMSYVVSDYKHLDIVLQKQKVKVVVNTAGPFQLSNYSVAESCIKAKVNYIDLADGRRFVCDIKALNEKALDAGVSIISGASTVPALSSAIIEHYLPHFSKLTLLNYGIAPAQKSELGLATSKGVMSYIGVKFNESPPLYGWQDVYSVKYPTIGKRFFGNCDIPDYELLPQKYSIESLRFSAGLEVPLLHYSLLALSYLVRFKLFPNLKFLAEPLSRLREKFHVFGTDTGGMHLQIIGLDKHGKSLEKWFFLEAFDNQCPYIPCVPAIVFAKILARVNALPKGAYPAVGMIKLEDYLKELREYPIKAYF